MVELEKGCNVKKINVLSLFDGMSCCQIALNNAGIKIKKYYASEIKDDAIKVTQHNYKKTIQLGSVSNWKDWDIKWSKIDLVTGGFPCQSWSIAGKQLGDKDERGKLFWVMLDIMDNVLKYNPKAKFLIENVKMKKEFEEYITYHTQQKLGVVEKHLFCSSLVSAQNRKRYYWTNIKGIKELNDRNIMLKDVIENDVITYKDKAYTLTLSNHSGSVRDFFLKSQSNILFFEDKNGKLFVDNGFVYFRLPKSKTPDKLHKIKCGLPNGNYSFRKLTRKESEKLQTVPVGYTDILPKSKAEDVLGNGWTVDIISHIFMSLKENV
jgi:DNA-cytosine methyltransferase